MSEPTTDVERVLAANLADLHSFLLRRVPDADAADALSDVLLVAWRSRERLPADDHEARMWLFGVAANVLRNGNRAQTRRQAMLRRLRADRSVQAARSSGAGAWVGVSGAGAAAAGADGGDEVSERVRDAIESLPSALAEIVRLRHWDGFSLEEAAAILGIPASTARGRYSAARRRLRVLLDGLAADVPPPSLRV